MDSPQLTHIALCVRDLQASVDFYRKYCGLVVAHHRESPSGRVVWLSEPGRETEFVFVLIPGQHGDRGDGRVSHFGFALGSREAVDEIAAQGASRGVLCWELDDQPAPVGYYCALRDPDGNVVEFSFGQPLGRAGR